MSHLQQEISHCCYKTFFIHCHLPVSYAFNLGSVRKQWVQVASGVQQLPDSPWAWQVYIPEMWMSPQCVGTSLQKRNRINQHRCLTWKLPRVMSEIYCSQDIKIRHIYISGLLWSDSDLRSLYKRSMVVGTDHVRMGASSDINHKHLL